MKTKTKENKNNNYDDDNYDNNNNRTTAPTTTQQGEEEEGPYFKRASNQSQRRLNPEADERKQRQRPLVDMVPSAWSKHLLFEMANREKENDCSAI